MDLENQFEKYWATDVKFLTCSLLGFCYTKFLPAKFGQGFKDIYIFTKNGYSSSYFKTDERKQYADFLKENFVKDLDGLKDFAQTIKSKADTITAFIDENINKEMNLQLWDEFLQIYCDYNGYHISPRHIIDFADPEKIDSFVPVLEEVRIYTEHVHPKTEEFLDSLLKQISEKENIEKDLLWLCTKEDIDQYFEEGTLPRKETLESREENAAQYFTSHASSLITDSDEINSIEKELNSAPEESEVIKGETAFKGKVTGKVRIVFSPENVESFEEGEILVTPMTRPDFVSLMEKASAFVTDSGGMLCHAAITAREMKKPCVIGTKFATKVLKDGDEVEVDADNGVVKILK
jgi:phosphohistidine swiveling domain-containing protein